MSNKKYSPYTFVACKDKILQLNNEGSEVSSIQTDSVEQLAKYIGDLDELLFKARKDLVDMRNDLYNVTNDIKNVISGAETRRVIS